MMESCKMFDNNIYSPIREHQSDIINNSNENSTESVGYITQAYNYSLGKLSLSTELQDDDQPEIEEKKITKEFSIELTNQIEYYESKPINSSFDINTITIEEKIIKQCDDNKLRKPRSKKNPEYNEKRAYKLRKYQIAENRRSITLPEDDDEIVSGSEDSRYATQTYDFTLDGKSEQELQ
ncbi:13129_t:CDS:2 [Rhizophagus irregularis]|nr:13129_t:CDS:2 [Rhizophagus irregularis]